MSLALELNRFIDKYVFSIPCAILKAKSKKPKKIKKILVIKLWALGDSILLLPTIKALKEKYPSARIDVLAHPKNKVIFEGQKFIDEIIDFGFFNILKLFGRYDLCIDAEPFLNVSAIIAFLSGKYRIGFSHGIRSRLYNEKVLFNKKQHMVRNYLDFIHGKNVEKLIPLYVSAKDEKLVSDYIKKNNLHKFVVLAPGVAESVKYRMWPVENFAKLGDELYKKGFQIVFVDSKSNKSLVEKIRNKMDAKSFNAVDEFGSLSKVRASAELMSKAAFVVTNDSGPMHMAAAQGAKVIGLFGPNTPVLWGPYGSGKALFKPKKGCPYLDNTKHELVPKHLTKEQMTCMDAIKVEDVLNLIK